MSFIGIIIGIVLGLILIAVITKISNSDFRTTTKYDERQVIVRGNGYKYGFWTMAILMLSYSFFEWGYPEIAERIPVQRFYVYFMIMLISVLIHTGYCIFNDGYFGINNNRRRWYVSFLCIGLANVLIGYANAARGKIWEDGKLGTPMISFSCGLAFVVIGIMIVIKALIDKSSGSDEDDTNETA